MVSIILIVAGAIGLSSLFQGTGLLEPLIRNVTRSVSSKGALILKTGLMSGALTAISDQSIAVIMPGKMLKEKFRELGSSDAILVRTIADTGTIIAPLIPWNVNALFILLTTGVTTLAYGPYAVLCYLSPLVTGVFAAVEMIQYKAPENAMFSETDGMN